MNNEQDELPHFKPLDRCRKIRFKKVGRHFLLLTRANASKTREMWEAAREVVVGRGAQRDRRGACPTGHSANPRGFRWVCSDLLAIFLTPRGREMASRDAGIEFRCPGFNSQRL